MKNTGKKLLISAGIAMMMVLLLSIPLYANDGVLGRTPDGVYPMQENDVVMESEEIVVDIEKNTTLCSFVFYNTGDAKNVLMGFPGKLDGTYEGLTPPVNLEIKNFKAYVGDKRLKITHEKNTKTELVDAATHLHFSEWFTFTIPFKKGERVTVKNTYSFSPAYDSSGNVYTGYVLKTGATWKDNIHSSKVTFKLGKIQPWQFGELRPGGGYRYEGNTLVWERKDFKPAYDLYLSYNSRVYSKEYLNEYAGEEEKAILQNKITAFTNIKELAAAGKTEELLKIYQDAAKENDYMLSLYAKSFLQPVVEVQPVLSDIKVTQETHSYHINCDVSYLGNSLIEISISHDENGNRIDDGYTSSPNAYFNFVPGVEYTIECTVTDWQDNVQKRSIKYTVPEQQPADATSHESKPVSGETVDPADVSDTGSDNSQDVSTANESAGGIRVLTAVAAAVAVAGLLGAIFLFIRRKQQ